MLHRMDAVSSQWGPAEYRPTPGLPEAFDEIGYRAFATGKWHNAIEAVNRCFAEGGDVSSEG